MQRYLPSQCNERVTKEHQINIRNAFYNNCQSYERQKINIANNIDREGKKSTKVLEGRGVENKQRQ